VPANRRRDAKLSVIIDFVWVRYVIICYFCRAKKQPPDPKVTLMEKRIGTITALIADRSMAPLVNEIISQHAGIVLARQGLPFHDRTVAVISLIVEGEVNQINALSGKLGKIGGVEAKAVVTRTG